jgi:hypothetical protein
MRQVTRFFLVVTVLIVSACATVYRKPGTESLPSSALGSLEVVHEGTWGVTIEEIDGQWRGMGKIQRYELPTGEHSIRAAVGNINYSGGGKIIRWFTVEAGKQYTIKTTLDPASMRWGLVVLDNSTGQRIDYDAPKR